MITRYLLTIVALWFAVDSTLPILPARRAEIEQTVWINYTHKVLARLFP